MQIELYIDGKKKIFTTPYVPMLARRKFFELMAQAEEREKREDPVTHKELLEEEDQMYSILSDIVFQGQFTLEQLYQGAEKEYIDQKLYEAIYGKRTTEGEKGNVETGK